MERLDLTLEIPWKSGALSAALEAHPDNRALAPEVTRAQYLRPQALKGVNIPPDAALEGPLFHGIPRVRGRKSPS